MSECVYSWMEWLEREIVMPREEKKTNKQKQTYFSRAHAYKREQTMDKRTYITITNA